MTPYEELKGLPKGEVTEKWLEQCGRCREVQQQVLLDILKRAENTVIGQLYHFEQIKSIADFQRTVPVLAYDDFQADIDAMAAGKEDVLFAGKPKLFLQTSGTTGNPKLLPESFLGSEVRYMVQHVREHYAREATIAALKKNKHFAQLAAQKHWGDVEALSGRRIFQDMHVLPLVTAAPVKKSAGGSPIDFASNISARKNNTQPLMTYPLEIAQVADKEAVMYLFMLFSLRFDDIVEIAGNHAGRLTAMIDYAREHAEELIDDLRQGTLSQRLVLTAEERLMLERYLEPLPKRADELEIILQTQEFTPRYYWPYLSSCVFWLSGSMSRQVYELDGLLPESAICIDIGYGSSEAKINIPTRANSGVGTLATFAGFFEFRRTSDGAVFTADEVEVGQKYSLMLTTYSGLYRYDLHDLVKVTGFNGNTPEITFVIREGDILNIGQEKFPADLLCQMAEEAAAIRLCQVWLNEEERCYELYLEPKEEEHRSESQLAAVMDAYLQEQFPPYGRYRQYKVINPLKVHLLPDGRKEALLESTAKIPLVLPAPLKN